MSFRSFMSNIAETSEMNSVGAMRSRYYRSNYAKTKAVVIEYAQTIKAIVRQVDDDHKEVFLQGPRFHIIVSFVQVTPIETSVDFKVEIYGVLGLNRPQKKIAAFYEYLDKNLTFKGVSLHP